MLKKQIRAVKFSSLNSQRTFLRFHQPLCFAAIIAVCFMSGIWELNQSFCRIKLQNQKDNCTCCLSNLAPSIFAPETLFSSSSPSLSQRCRHLNRLQVIVLISQFTYVVDLNTDAACLSVCLSVCLRSTFASYGQRCSQCSLVLICMRSKLIQYVRHWPVIISLYFILV
jgi:hypothetical protein